MALIKNKQLVTDSWTVWDGEAPLAGDVIVTYELWQDHRDALIAHDGRLGIQLQSDQAPSLIAGDVDRFEVIALEFPVFKDGRAFSYARLLRERYDYEGELRAVGEVLRDQAFFMERCGFDAFEISDEMSVDGFLEGLSEFTHVYQPSTDRRPFVVATRHRLAHAAE